MFSLSVCYICCCSSIVFVSFFFFFKQKPAYEVRISDWSSDVCSSDLNMKDWDGRPMPRFAKSGKQLMDPITAYQVVHMLEGVVQRGTAQRLRDLGVPMFGKTGTTSGPNDVWFVGGTPDVVAGLFYGFAQPPSLGGHAPGGRYAAPTPEK